MAFPWLEIVDQARRTWRTPFYVVAWHPIREAIDQLAPLSQIGIPVRHWFSIKTQPVKPLLVAWRQALGFGAEVVSLYELMAAKEAGFEVDNIVVNGPGKHSWLPKGNPGLHVHLDSIKEIEAIGVHQLCEYRLGVRCHVDEEYDPDDKAFGTQFGMVRDELSRAVELLASHNKEVEGVHFHMRSNVRDVESYGRALEQGLEMACSAGVAPKYVDCGGGLPAPGEGVLEEGRVVEDQINIFHLTDSIRVALQKFPSVRELWFENGRFVTSRGAVLVVRVLDVKERPECRYLICDGGRTNHAFPSDGQDHCIGILPTRTGPEVLTTVCGPTCMAYDRLVRRKLPRDITVGDHIIWFNAGAYHIPLETRFSHGFANVIWCDEQMKITLARAAESFQAWWGSWA